MRKFTAQFTMEILHGPRCEEFLCFSPYEEEWVNRWFIRMRFISLSKKITIEMNIFKDFSPMWYDNFTNMYFIDPEQSYPIQLIKATYSPKKQAIINTPILIEFEISESSEGFIIRHANEDIEWFDKDWDYVLDEYELFDDDVYADHELTTIHSDPMFSVINEDIEADHQLATESLDLQGMVTPERESYLNWKLNRKTL